jgi:dihydrofolate reductase
MDGVMQAPGGPDEDRDGGFEYGGWTAPFFDDKAGQNIADWMSGAGAFLLGRKTYEIFAGYWPNVADPNDAVAKALNEKPKYVASHTLKSAEWAPTTVIKDVPSDVRRLKEEDGAEIQVHGSGNLMQTLLKHDLVDTFRLWLFPVLLGTGKRLFGEGTVPASFKLTDMGTTETGCMLHVYERAGAVKVGTVGE